MAKNKRRWLLWIALVVFAVNLPVTSADEKRTVVRPEDTGAALENPGMGWVLHYYDNRADKYGSRLSASDTVDDFPSLTVIYLRIPWSYLELEEGRFNWSVLDTPAQRWVAKGKQIALRISCSESFMRYATPQWVEKAGAKGYNFERGKGVIEDGPFWEPNFDDPIFLEKLDNFLAALAERYDGNPEVAFIDVGSLGVWGEGHMDASSKRVYSAATRKKHIDLHCKNFKHTLLAVNDDYAEPGVPGRRPGYYEVIDYARAKGLTLRDDSILVEPGIEAYYHAGMAQAFWPNLPVILESQHYGSSKERGYWGDGSLYLKAVEEYHASYASIHWWPRDFLNENLDLVRRINLRLGYRLQMLEASWPSELSVNSSFRFVAKWRNGGVAPCLPGGYPAVTLKDKGGGIVGVFVDNGFNVNTLYIGPPGEAKIRTENVSFELAEPLTCPDFESGIKPGIYDLYISVGTRTGTPRIALPLPESDGQRRYRLGVLKIGDSAGR